MDPHAAGSAAPLTAPRNRVPGPFRPTPPLDLPHGPAMPSAAVSASGSAATRPATADDVGSSATADHEPAAGSAPPAHPSLLARRGTIVPASTNASTSASTSRSAVPAVSAAPGPEQEPSSDAAPPPPLASSLPPPSPLPAIWPARTEWDRTLSSVMVPRPQRLQSLQSRERSFSPSRFRSPSLSRSPSPARSRSTSPPPSASSAFASAQSISASSDDDDEDSTFEEERGKAKSKPDQSEARRASAAPKTTFATLPYEILIQILRCVQNISPSELNRCLTVNRQWCQAGLELIWYKPTFHSAGGFDRMVLVLAGSCFQPLAMPLDSALAQLHLAGDSHANSISSATATAAGPTAGAEACATDAEASAPSGPAASALADVASNTSGHSPSDKGTPHAPPRSLDFVSSPPSSSLTPDSASTTSVSAEGEHERREILFPYADYVRRINCCWIGKELSGTRAEAFRALSQCRHLERLTLAGARSLPDAVLRDVLPKCTAMVAIDLTDVVDLTDDTLAAIARACPRLQGINLTNCANITSVGVVPLALHCPLLRRVKLGNCNLIDDHAVVALARNCRHLLEMDLTGCSEVSDTGVAALWRHTHVLRELKLTACNRLTSLGFPAHNAGLVRRINVLPNGVVLDNEREEDPDTILSHDANSQPQLSLLDEDDVSHESAAFSSDVPSLHLWGPPLTRKAATSDHPDPPSKNSTTEEEEEEEEEAEEEGSSLLTPLAQAVRSPRPPRIFEQLRILDLGNCNLLTDSAVEGIINHSPKVRNLVLSKCSLLTDDAIYAISRLGKNLHYLHLGRCEKITDRSVKFLARNCTRLRYIDLAYCPELTDDAVRDIGINLPKLRRIGLVKVQNLTDAALIALVEKHTSLERIHLSYCDRLTVPGVFYAVLRLNKLTHLSLTGVPAFRKMELQRMCRAPPPEFNEHQRATFCVYSGRGVHALRGYLSGLYLVWRRMVAPLDSQPGTNEGSVLSSRLYSEAITACRTVGIVLPQEGERAEDALARAARQAAVTLGLEHIRIPASKGMPALPSARAPEPNMADTNTVHLLMNILPASDQFSWPHRVAAMWALGTAEESHDHSMGDTDHAAHPSLHTDNVANWFAAIPLLPAPRPGGGENTSDHETQDEEHTHMPAAAASTAASRFVQAYRSGWLGRDPGGAAHFNGTAVRGEHRAPPTAFDSDFSWTDALLLPRWGGGDGQMQRLGGAWQPPQAHRSQPPALATVEDEDEPRMGTSAHTHAQAQAHAHAQARARARAQAQAQAQAQSQVRVPQGPSQRSTLTLTRPPIGETGPWTTSLPGASGADPLRTVTPPLAEFPDHADGFWPPLATGTAQAHARTTSPGHTPGPPNAPLPQNPWNTTPTATAPFDVAAPRPFAPDEQRWGPRAGEDHPGGISRRPPVGVARPHFAHDHSAPDLDPAPAPDSAPAPAHTSGPGSGSGFTPAPHPPLPQSRASQWALDPALIARLDRVLRGERVSQQSRG